MLKIKGYKRGTLLQEYFLNPHFNKVASKKDKLKVSELLNMMGVSTMSQPMQNQQIPDGDEIKVKIQQQSLDCHNQ